jgi:hypothetical protein
MPQGTNFVLLTGPQDGPYEEMDGHDTEGNLMTAVAAAEEAGLRCLAFALEHPHYVSPGGPPNTSPTWRGNHAHATRDRVGGILVGHTDGSTAYVQPGDAANELAEVLDGCHTDENMDVLLCDQLEGVEPGPVGA